MATYNQHQAKEMESFGFNMVQIDVFNDGEPIFAIGFFDDEIKLEKIKSIVDKHDKLMDRNQRSENSVSHTFDMEKGLSSVEMVTEDDIIGIVKSGALGRDEILNLKRRIKSLESMDEVRDLRKEMLSDHCDKCKEETKSWPEWKRRMAGIFLKENKD